MLKEKFNTKINQNELEKIIELININKQEKNNRKHIKIKVYSNFLKDIILDMGYTISDTDYDFIVMPDYMNINSEYSKPVIIIPSHKNVSKNIIQRIKERYELLEIKLCTKQ